MFGVDIATAQRRRLTGLRRRIGVVFQDYRLLDHLTVYENVALPLAITGAREADYAANVRELVGWVGLGDRMEARPRMLSGGEQQRVAIARAVVGRPIFWSPTNRPAMSMPNEPQAFAPVHRIEQSRHLDRHRHP